MGAGGQGTPSPGEEGKQVFRFGTPATKLGIGFAALMFPAFTVGWIAVIFSKLRAGTPIGDLGWSIFALALLIFVLVVLAIYGPRTWKARIELSGRDIAYVSGNHRVEESLQNVASLHSSAIEGGEGYRIVFRSGKRIDFNSTIEGAETLRRQVEHYSGKRF